MAEFEEIQNSPTQQRAADKMALKAYRGKTPTAQVHYRIDGGTFAIMMFFAGIFDFLGLSEIIAPGAGTVIDVIAQFMIGLIFAINGVSLIERKFLVRFILFSVIEFIPFLSMFPMLMAEVYMLTALTWIADKALATATKATSKVVGDRFAGATVGLAYGRMITGQAPLPHPEDSAKQPKSLRQAVGLFGGAMKKDAVSQFGRMPESKLPPSERGGGVDYVDGMRVPSKAQQAEAAPSMPQESGVEGAARTSVDGIRPETRETSSKPKPEKETSTTPSPQVTKPLETPTQQKTTPEETSPSLSRRKVLAMLGGAGVLLATEPLPVMAAMAARPGASAHTVWREAITVLKNDALMGEKEAIGLFVQDGNTARFTRFQETNEGASFARLPLADIQEALRNVRARIEFFHTHPLSLLQRARGYTPGLAAPQTFGDPPSMQDIKAALFTNKALGQKSQQLTYAVVDPIGTWQYQIDKNHPIMRQMNIALEREGSAATLLQRKDLQAEIEAFEKKNDIDTSTDPRIKFGLLYTKRDTLSPALKKTIEEVFEPNLQFLQKNPEANALVLAAEYEPLTADYTKEEVRSRTIQTYRQAGVTLTFTPH